MVGIKTLTSKYGSFTKDQAITFDVILNDLTGTPITDQPLSYSIYKNNQYWWWEIRRENQLKLNFKKKKSTSLVSSGSLVSGVDPIQFDFVPNDSGTYFIEVTHAEGNNHSAGQFFEVSSYGSSQVSADKADILTLFSDKDSYVPGDIATISFPTAPNSKSLVSIEQGSNILNSFWIDTPETQTEASFTLPISDNMIPNVYVSVSSIQPHSQTHNDLPLRSYGIIPIMVKKPQHLFFNIDTTPESLNPTSHLMSPFKPQTINQQIHVSYC